MTSLPAQSRPTTNNASHLMLPPGYESQRPRAVSPLPPHLSLAPYYDLALYLRMRTGTPCILDIGPTDPTCLSTRFGPDAVAVIGDRPTLERAKAHLPKNRLFLQNFNDPLSLPDRVLAQSIVVCADLLHRLERPEAMLASLQRASEIAPFVIIGTPDRGRLEGFDHAGPPSLGASTRHWRFDEMQALLRSYGLQVPFAGHVGPWGLLGSRMRSVHITGTHCLTNEAPKRKVVALVSCYNDIDIIEHCYRHLKAQGIAVAFIDNWSQDGTWEKICSWREQDPSHCVYVEQFPFDGPSDDYQWAKILKRKTQLGQQLDFDWFIHHDSDEIRESPLADITMAEAISRIDALGYTAIDHTVLDFRPVDDTFNGTQAPEHHYSYFEFGSRVDHFMQMKAWKKQDKEIDLTAFGGHVTVFPKFRLYPFNFLLKHYSVRSPAHARIKFFKHRLPRIKKEEKELNWHTHLREEVSARESHQFVWRAENLLTYTQGTFADEYVLPRLTGIGINEKNRLSALFHYGRQTTESQML